MVAAFWQLFPMGTRLSSGFVSRQLKFVGTFLKNSIRILLMAAWRLLKTWVVLIYPYLKSGNNLYRDICPFEERPLRIAFYVGFCVPLFFISGIIFVFIYVAAVVIVVALAALITTILIVWIIGASIAFLLWFSLYRYPVFEIIYPRIRTWMLRRNATVYNALPRDSNESIASIRIVRIKPGQRKDPIECELVVADLATARFEALSYVWGVTLVPYKIKVDGKDFYITYNLHSALQQLRRPNTERLVWIDAMGINQFDSDEKSAQVQLMRSIYYKASQVVVWLGKGSEATRSVFDLMRRLKDTRVKEDRDSLWATEIASPQWRQSRREIQRILLHDWWTRMWIIQEVVAGHHVVIQRGSEQIEWESFYELVSFEPFLDVCDIDTTDFARNIQQLRADMASQDGSSKSLLGLAYRFRHQSATFGSDKLYALLGLLKANDSTSIIPDYNKIPEDVFLDFTVSSIRNNKSLNAIGIAPDAALEGVSWCRDWRFENDGLFPITWFSVYPPPHKDYCAAGGSTPIFTADIEQRILTVKGIEMDVISKLGDFDQSFHFGTIDWDFKLRNWERTAGGPWSADKRESYDAFNRTITADCWEDGNPDWQTRIRGAHPNAAEQNNEEFLHVIADAMQNRRFFVTRDGRFGLGPWNLKIGDTVVVLLGSTVPFALRKEPVTRPLQTSVSKYESEHSESICWKVIGELFCDGLMYYEGSIAEDIEEGKIEVKDYALH